MFLLGNITDFFKKKFYLSQDIKSDILNMMLKIDLEILKVNDIEINNIQIDYDENSESFNYESLNTNFDRLISSTKLDALDQKKVLSFSNSDKIKHWIILSIFMQDKINEISDLIYPDIIIQDTADFCIGMKKQNHINLDLENRSKKLLEKKFGDSFCFVKYNNQSEDGKIFINNSNIIYIKRILLKIFKIYEHQLFDKLSNKVFNIIEDIEVDEDSKYGLNLLKKHLSYKIAYDIIFLIFKKEVEDIVLDYNEEITINSYLEYVINYIKSEIQNIKLSNDNQNPFNYSNKYLENLTFINKEDNNPFNTGLQINNLNELIEFLKQIKPKKVMENNSIGENITEAYSKL